MMLNNRELDISEKYFEARKVFHETFGMFQLEYQQLYPSHMLIAEAQKATHARDADGHCIKLVLNGFICCSFYDCGKTRYEKVKDPEQIKDYFTDEKKLLNVKKRALECLATGQLIEALRGCGDEDIRSAAFFKKGERVLVNELTTKKLMTILELFGMGRKLKIPHLIFGFKVPPLTEKSSYCEFNKKLAYITDGLCYVVIRDRRKLKKLYLAF